ncbi:hypothetical protein ABPG77_002474 [Micractinium sp. CCAP 211/92]
MKIYRLHSPARQGRGNFDPFAVPPDDELPGHTPLVKRSLNGAVAAAGGTAAATLARRSLDAPPVASAQQVAGISRKRLEAELLSPPLPRKSSRTLMDGEHAADMLARLHLAGPTGGAMQCEPAPRFAH